MGTLVRKEVYTTQQPDGTFVTTTTKTTTEADTTYDVVHPTMNVEYCCTFPAILRILQIIVGFIVVGCVSGYYGTGPYLGVLAGQTYVLIVAGFCVCLTFVFLVIFCLGLHSHVCNVMPWRSLDLLYSVIAVILYFVAGCLECWYASGAWRRNCNYFANGNWLTCPVYSAWAVAAAFCFVNVLLYALGAFFATRKKFYM